MYNNITELFNKEKLKIMIDSQEPSTVFFPNKTNTILKSDINSPLALAFSTVLKAGFNIQGIELKKINDNEVSVVFEGQEIQKFKFYFSDDYESKINSTQLNADKTTIVIFDKNKILNNDEPLSNYLHFISKFTPESGKTINVGNLRRESLNETGMYIEEYEGNSNLLNNSDIFDSTKISHYNTFSTPIIMEAVNIEDILNLLNKVNISGDSSKSIEIQTTIESVRNIPLESFNPINTISNYRNLDHQHIADSKIHDFLNTLMLQAKTHLQLKNELSNADKEGKSNLYKNSITSAIEKNLETHGNSKKLFTLAPNRAILEDDKTENKVYISNNKICINSKGSCLGNGQHSTTTFNLLYLILNHGADAKFELFEKLDLSSSKLSKLFNVNDKTPISQIQKELFDTIQSNGLDIIQFLDFFNSMTLKVSWDIVSDVKTLEAKIKSDNNQQEQDRSDSWINENKEYVSQWLNSYKKINSDIISKYKKNGISLDISGIKTTDNSPGTSLETLTSSKLNDLFPYICFILPNNKHLTPIDAKYTSVHNDKTKDSADNSRNVYQQEVFDEKLSIFWSDLLHKKFKAPGSQDTFAEFISANTNESKIVIKNKLKKNIKFHQIHETYIESVNHTELFKKVAATVIFKDMAEKMFGESKGVLDQCFKNSISPDNFTKLAFFSFSSKLGKSNFNIDNVEKYGAIILKDIVNEFHDYYSNSELNTKSTDKWKRISAKDSMALDEEVKTLINQFMINLFEPFQNKNRYNTKGNYNYSQEDNWVSTIDKRRESIENKFKQFFKDIKKTTNKMKY